MTSDVLDKVRRAATGDRALNLVASMLPMLGSLLALPFLARHLSPGELAVWALVMTSVSAIQLLDLGISASVMKHAAFASARGDIRTAWAYAWTSAWVFAGVAAVATLLVLTAPVRNFVDARTEASVGQVLALVVACVLLAPVTNCFLVLLRATGQYWVLLWSLAVGQVVFLGGVAAAVAGDALDLGTALLCQTGQFAVTMAVLLLASGRAAVPARLSAAAVRGMFSFGLVMLVVNACNAVLMYAPLWCANLLLPPDESGAYAFASTLAVAARNLPLMTLAPVVNRLARAEDIWATGSRELRHWTWGMAVYFACATVGAFVLAGPLGGAQYASVGWLTAFLVVGYGVGTVSAVDSQVLRMTGHQKWEARAWVAGMLLMLALVVPSVAVLGVAGAASVALVAQALGTVLMRTFVSRSRGTVI